MGNSRSKEDNARIDALFVAITALKDAIQTSSTLLDDALRDVVLCTDRLDKFRALPPLRKGLSSGGSNRALIASELVIALRLDQPWASLGFELAETLPLHFVITAISPGSPAHAFPHKMGLRIGDRLLAVNGAVVSDLVALLALLQAQPMGAALSLRVLRTPTPLPSHVIDATRTALLRPTPDAALALLRPLEVVSRLASSFSASPGAPTLEHGATGGSAAAAELPVPPTEDKVGTERALATAWLSSWTPAEAGKLAATPSAPSAPPAPPGSPVLLSASDPLPSASPGSPVLLSARLSVKAAAAAAKAAAAAHSTAEQHNDNAPSPYKSGGQLLTGARVSAGARPALAPTVSEHSLAETDVDEAAAALATADDLCLLDQRGLDMLGVDIRHSSL